MENLSLYIFLIQLELAFIKEKLISHFGLNSKMKNLKKDKYFRYWLWWRIIM